MSEYFVGRSGGDGSGASPAPGAGPAGGAGPTASSSGPEHVRFGVPFNGVLPVWHDGTEITWHRTLDGVDPADVLGLGVVETEAGPSPVPEGWSEQVETGTLMPVGRHAADDVGPVLRLRAATPTGRRALNDPGDGVSIRLSPPLTVPQAMGAGASDFDITGFSVHVARLMLRAARDSAILLFTLRAPQDPEPHHLLSAPSEVDSFGIMHFHLGTLLAMEAGAWAGAQRTDGMTLLDLDIPYGTLVAEAGPDGEEGLHVDKLVAMAQPVVDAILKPGFPFALGCSFIVPDRS